MAKENTIKVDGVIKEALPNATFKVELENGHIITAHVSGKMRMHYIKMVPGDKVKIEISPYDLTKGRITYRNKWFGSYDESKSICKENMRELQGYYEKRSGSRYM